MAKDSLSSTMKIYMLYHRNLILPTEKYYVYTHKNPLTQKIFYVGAAKGNPLRAYEFEKHRNSQWKKEVMSFGGICNVIVDIVQVCGNPIEAQKLEFQLIYKLKEKGEAYCNNEGDISFERKYPVLKYHLYIKNEYISFARKTELFMYCKEKYELNRNIINLMIDTGQEYKGTKEKANGLKIIKEGKEKE